jgi:outer membrane receptor protein involved in Fe transport
MLALFATLFQTEFDNVFFNDILASGAQVGRSAQTRTRGIELEGAWRPADVLNINVSITYQEPEYRFRRDNAQTGTVAVSPAIAFVALENHGPHPPRITSCSAGRAYFTTPTLASASRTMRTPSLPSYDGSTPV